VTRRTFIGAATVSVAALATGSFSPGILRAVAAPRGTVTRNRLYIPPEIPLPSLGPLSAAPASIDLGGGKLSSVLAYNGSFPGPTIRAYRSDSANIHLINGLVEETTVHWHGMVVPHKADGHPLEAVAPGAAYDYIFPIVQRACMNWYHPHPHMLTGKQVCLGLAGAFIINDINGEEAALGLPFGTHEVPLILRDANLDRAGNLIYNPVSSGFVGKIPLVNGTRDPYLAVDRAVYRLRVLNGANARLFRLALSNGAPFTLIGNDGGLLGTAATVPQIEFGPAERLDLLVDFHGLPVGTKLMLRDLNAGWDLLEFVVGSVSGGGSIPTALSTITPLVQDGATRVFSFDGMTRINGKEFDMNRIDFQVPFGKTELWRFITNGNGPHPVHVHGTSFQVQSRSGGRGVVFPWERGWKDTVLLQDGETVDVLIRFDGQDGGKKYTGVYLLHCHKLEHEDHGMMSNFEVV
jgi:FtsP/CotA-like multicopper oxidase with cupredoxin domain